MGLGEAADSQTCPRGTAPQLLAPQLLLTVIYCSCQLKTHKDSCCSTGLSNALFAGRHFIEEVDTKKKESMWTGLHNTGPLEPEPRVLTPRSEDLISISTEPQPYSRPRLSRMSSLWVGRNLSPTRVRCCVPLVSPCCLLRQPGACAHLCFHAANFVEPSGKQNS